MGNTLDKVKTAKQQLDRYECLDNKPIKNRKVEDKSKINGKFKY